VLLRDLGVAPQDDRAGRLPLLAHALRATWQQRRGHLLTVDGYQATGGIERAIATTADRAYDSLDTTAQEEARVLFLRLVIIGGGGSDTRRRLGRAELLRDFDEPALGAVLDVFTQRRLLTQEQDTVTITHEALVYAWPRLRTWIDSDRIGNILGQDLNVAASSWEGEQHDPAVLYRGSRLAAARAWAAAHGRDLSATASAFLDASIRQEDRAARTRHVAVALLATLTLIASVTAGIALFLRHQALVQRDQAIVSQVTTEADQLQATDPSLAAQLDLVANHMQPGNSSLYTSLIDAENTPMSAVLASPAAVFSVAFSHDGRLLATNSEHGTVQLWNVANLNQPVKTGPPLQGNDGVTRSLAFSPRDSILASATPSGVQLWSVADPAHPSLDGKAASGGDTAIAIGPDGRVLAVTVGNTVGLWDITDPARPVAIGQPLRAAGPTLSVAFSHDGDILAAGTSTDTIQLWNISDPAHPVPLGHPIDAYSENVSTGRTQEINALTFSPDLKMLADGDANGVIQLWNLDNPARPVPVGQVLDSHDGGVLGIAFSPDGDTLASGNLDDKIALWNVAKPTASYVTGRLLSGHTATVMAVAFDPRGHVLASGSFDGTARLWTLSPTTLGIWPAIDSVAFSPSGDLLAVGGADGTIQLRSTASRAHPRLLARALASQSQAIWSRAFSPDGGVLVAGSQDRTVRLWNVANPAAPVPLTPAFAAGVGAIRGLVFAHGDVLFASSLSSDSSNGTVSVWNVTDPAHPSQAAPPLAVGPGSGYSMALSADGRTLAVQGLISVGLWDVSDPVHATLVSQTPTQLTGIHAVAFGPGGLLADAGFDNTIKLWNVGDPAHPAAVGAPITGPTGTIGSIAFSHDGKILASSGQDEVIRLWNVANPTRPVSIGNPLISHTNSVWSIAWSPTGTLATGSVDGTVRLWDLQLPAAVKWICSTTANTLTPAQWRHYIPELAYRPACPG
jgi:WD40 repeat protein